MDRQPSPEDPKSSIWTRHIKLSGASALIIVGAAVYQWYRVEVDTRKMERQQEERDEALHQRIKEAARIKDRAMAQLEKAVKTYGVAGLDIPYRPEESTGSQRPMTERDAEEKLLSLPEIKAMAVQTEKHSNGEAHLLVRPEGATLDQDTELEPKQCWQFYVGEDHEDHIVRIYTFFVGRQGQVYIGKPTGGWTPYQEWRVQISDK